jgi:nickel-dependent lactate racemase
MKRELTFTYGTERRTLQIDGDAMAAPFVHPRATKGTGTDPAARMREALERPVARPALRAMVEGRSVAVVVADEFRKGLQERILDVLLGEIAAGSPARVVVIGATGTHDPTIYTPSIRRWALDAGDKHGLHVDFIGHDCDDRSLVSAGVTARGTTVAVEPAWLRADVRVFGHEAKHHYFAGYSNVLKLVVPGIASRATVANNHKLTLDDDARGGRHPLHHDEARRTNPVAEDMLEAYRLAVGMTLDDSGALVERGCDTFLLDMISDGDDVFWTRAGDPEAVTAEALGQADLQAEFTVPRSRYVVVSPGGPPASTALYGVQNCFDLAVLGAIEDGGEALVLGPCNGRSGVPDGVRGLAPDVKSKALFWDNLVRMRDWPLEDCRREIEGDFKLYLWKTWRVLRLLKRDRVRLYIHGELPADVLAQGGFHHAPDAQAWIDDRLARGDGRFVAIDNGNKLLVRGE